MTPQEQNTKILHDLEVNRKLLEENNKLLKKVHRSMRWGIILQVLWYVMLIGLPFALYFYILEPYFNALGSSFEIFNAGMQEIPGLKQFHELFGSSTPSQG